MSFFKELTTFGNERRQVAELMPQLGFGVMIPSDENLRPMRAAWYGGNWQGRHAVATVIRRQYRHAGSQEIGNRYKNVACLQLTLEPSLRRAIGLGVSKPFATRSPTTVAEAFPPDHAAYGLHPLVKDAFVALIQPEPSRSKRRNGPHLRITDRAVLDDYLPATVHPNAPSLVMREIAIEDDLPQKARYSLDTMAWLASILESTEIPS